MVGPVLAVCLVLLAHGTHGAHPLADAFLPVENVKVVEHSVLEERTGRRAASSTAQQRATPLVVRMVSFETHQALDARNPELWCEPQFGEQRYPAVKPEAIGAYDQVIWGTRAFLFVPSHMSTTTIVPPVSVLQNVLNPLPKFLSSTTGSAEMHTYQVWVVGIDASRCNVFAPWGNDHRDAASNATQHAVPARRFVRLVKHSDTVTRSSGGPPRRRLLTVTGQHKYQNQYLQELRDRLNESHILNSTSGHLHRGLQKWESRATMAGLSAFFDQMGKDRHARGKHPLRHAQKTVDARNERALYLNMLELSTEASAFARAGVRTQEVFALVADKIMNRMPEIMLQVLVSIMREPMLHFGAQFLQANTLGLIAPNDEKTPETPVVQSILPTSIKPLKDPPKPGQPCKKPKKKSDKKKNDEKKEDKPEEKSEFPCEIDEFGNRNPGHKRHLDVQLVEVKARTKGADGNYDRMQEGGEHGGPIARVTPMLRQTVMHGLATHVVPYLEDELAARISSRFDMVSNTIVRNVVRETAPKLIRATTLKTVGAVHNSMYTGSLKHSQCKLTQRMTKALTQAVSASITLAMTRNSRTDYYCMYCKQHQLFCKYCSAAQEQEQQMTHYVNYYASYFGDYYGKMYCGIIGDHFNQMGRAKWEERKKIADDINQISFHA